MQRIQQLLLVIPVVLVLSAGCNRSRPVREEPNATPAGKPAASPESTAPPTPEPIPQPGPEAAPTLTGKVVETLSASRYTYVLVDTGTEKAWAAAPTFQVEVGDEVLVPSGVPMANFHSRTLDRVFERILFVGWITVKGREGSPTAAGLLPEGHPPLPGTSGQVSPGAHGAGGPTGLPPGHAPVKGQSGAAEEIDVGEVARAEGGMTVAEIFAGRKELAGKEVVLRGKVVKFTSRILGTNWLHVRDGSGSEGTNDLTVRTHGEAKVGDAVVIRGTVVLEKDFGAGYKYDVLIEEAQLTVE